jgi:hypothetical protein
MQHICHAEQFLEMGKELLRETPARYPGGSQSATPLTARFFLVVYLWSDADPAVTKIQLISATQCNATEIRYYQEGL